MRRPPCRPRPGLQARTLREAKNGPQGPSFVRAQPPEGDEEPWGGPAVPHEDHADLIASHFAAGTRLTVPDGGVLLWVQLPEGASGDRLFAEALGCGIKISPGSVFTAGRRFGGCIRLGCGRSVDDEVRRALRELGGLL